MKKINKVNVLESLMSEEALSKNSMSVIAGGQSSLDEAKMTFLDNCNCPTKSR